ncbi:MAG TPA: DNA internalization-related competence protein ComEC/Rec2, partial [Eoetvoesiella sp.]
MTGRLSVLAVVAATGAVQCFTQMPDFQVWIYLVAGTAGLSLVFLALQRRYRCCGVPLSRILIPVWAGVLGLLVTVARVEYRLADELASGNENQVSRVVLRVAGLVKINPESRQFEADVISSKPGGVPSRIYV